MQSVSIALECGDILNEAFLNASDVSDGSTRLQHVLRRSLPPLERVVRLACTELRIRYGGIDASMNPGLRADESVGAALADLGRCTFSAWGTLSCVAAVTYAIKAVAADDCFLATGYCGMMLPVMEDVVLADEKNRYSLKDLLMYSAVCGVGLDTVPVPGSITADELTPVLRDVAALAFRLAKPLSVRLLLMRGKQKGDRTEIKTDENPHIVNATVMGL